MKKIIIGLVIVLALAAAAYGATHRGARKNGDTKENQAEGSDSLKVAIIKTNSDSRYVIGYAIANGYFSRQGLDVKIIDADKAPYLLVEAREADLMIGGISRPLSVFFNGAQPRLLFNAHRPFGLYAISRFDIQNAAQIKKAVVNVLQGENQQQVDLALRNIGVDPDKVEHVAAPTVPARIAMLVNGGADFTVISDRSIYDSSEQLKTFFLFGSDIIQKDSQQLQSAVTTQEVIGTKAEALKKFTAGFYDARQDMQNDKDASVRYAREAFSFNESQAEEFYSQFLKGVQESNFVPEVGNLDGSLADAKKDAADPNRNVGEFIDASFARQAVAR